MHSVYIICRQQENIINHFKCHILFIILRVCGHTPLLGDLIYSGGNLLRINFTEGHRKLPVSAAVSGEF